MTIGIWVLGDQLSLGQSALASCEPGNDQVAVILIESLSHVKERPYHKQKLVLVWSAMRHFAEELRQQGWSVTYVEQAEDFQTPLNQWIREQNITELRLMQPCDRTFQRYLKTLKLACELTITPNNQFFWSDAAFAQWAKGRKSLLMETFYREGRKRFDVMMDGDEPAGNQWNFDKQNRKPPKGDLNPPDPLWFEPDEMTQAVIDQVNAADYPTYGQATPFRWGTTREQALQVLQYFVEVRLPTFGPYQDAMVTGEETMWHGLISPYMNVGLLHPEEIVRAVEQAWRDRKLPLNSVEGFIRQVLGWREYMRGLYSYVSDDYPAKNFFEHNHPLPQFFWDAAQADMNCLKQVLSQLERTGYAHHIQRLMVLANFSLIAGLSPQEVESWFHATFIDAYDWVMQTNVIGMGLFADGGMLASKPYASSANYINKMSDYCQSCAYSRTKRTGKDACPFNFFYWDFLSRQSEKLKSQGRMNLILANLKKMTAEELDAIHQQAEDWHKQHTS